jgi:hypothetical protein
VSATNGSNIIGESNWTGAARALWAAPSLDGLPLKKLNPAAPSLSRHIAAFWFKLEQRHLFFSFPLRGVYRLSRHAVNFLGLRSRSIGGPSVGLAQFEVIRNIVVPPRWRLIAEAWGWQLPLAAKDLKDQFAFRRGQAHPAWPTRACLQQAFKECPAISLVPTALLGPSVKGRDESVLHQVGSINRFGILLDIARDKFTHEQRKPANTVLKLAGRSHQ